MYYNDFDVSTEILLFLVNYCIKNEALYLYNWNNITFIFGYKLTVSKLIHLYSLFYNLCKVKSSLRNCVQLSNSQLLMMHWLFGEHFEKEILNIM